jgi:NADPH:quinone reductase-like Zn-dependent oxidoreductase
MFRRQIAQIGDLAARHPIAPPPAATVAFEAAGQAIQALAGRSAVGKTIVRVGDWS